MAKKLEIKSLRFLVKLRENALKSLRATGERQFKENFRQGGYYRKGAKTRTRWKARKKDDGSGRGVLIGKRSRGGGVSLRNSIKGRENPRRWLVRFRSPLDYAEVHNEGYRGTQNVRDYTRTNKRKTKSGRKGTPKSTEVSAHTRKQNIPARPYMTSNKKLASDVVKQLGKEIRRKKR